MSKARHSVVLRKSAISASLQPRNKSSNTALVVNPNSCSGLTGKNWDELFAKFKRIFGDDIKVSFSEKPGHATDLARGLLKKGTTRIVAIGGSKVICSKDNQP